MSARPPRTSLQRAHRRIAIVAGSAAVGMLGLSFAAVPLYRVFCQATGFAGTTQVAESAPTTRGKRVMTVQFDSNVGDLPWTFEPEVPSVKVRTGETKTVFFKVTNESDSETAGVAAYNVTPPQAGAYFTKISCFCFDVTHVGPRQTVELPVVFFLSPDLEKDESMKDVGGVTLSYTFFSDKKGEPATTQAQTKSSANF